MSDIALSNNGMMFVTPDGEGFSGVWAGEYKKYGEKKGEEWPPSVLPFNYMLKSTNEVLWFI